MINDEKHGPDRPKDIRCLDDLRGGVAAWALGLVLARDLPQIGVTALCRGLDNEWFRELAGLSSSDVEDAEKLLRRALEECGWGVPDKYAAVREYATCVSRLIVSGEVTPPDGARALWSASLAVGDDDFHELDPFIYASSEYDDRPADRPLFERGILAEAKRWADRTASSD